METKKKIIVLAGPSGVGKSTLSNILLNYSDTFEFSISATTRAIRLGEKNCENYFFLSEEEFKEKIDADEFVEYVEVYPGRWYGTLKSEVERINKKDNIAIFDIDVLGALKIKEKYGDEVFVIFIKPESTQALEERLRSRGSETEEQIKTRVERFEEELSYEHSFDFTLTNKTGEIATAKKELIEIANEHFLKTSE